MKIMLFFVASFGFMAYGQEPATKQDVQELRNEVQQTKQATDRVAKSQDAARSAEKQELNGIKTAVTASSETQKAIAAEVAKSSEEAKGIAAEVAKQKDMIAAEAARNRRTMSFIEFSFAGLVLVGGATLAWWVRRGRNAGANVPASSAEPLLDCSKRPGEARRLMNAPIFDVPTQRSTSELPENPRPNEIKQYAAVNPNVSSFDVHFVSDGRRIKGTVKKDGTGVLSMNFLGYPNTAPCGIDKAYKTAIFLLSPTQSAEQKK